MAISREQITDILQTIIDPVSGKNLMDANIIRALTIDGDTVKFVIEVAPDVAPQMEPVRVETRSSPLPRVRAELENPPSRPTLRWLWSLKENGLDCWMRTSTDRLNLACSAYPVVRQVLMARPSFRFAITVSRLCPWA